ncbi:MAG: GMC family oxidoreductase [Saprospiraceae bacterium]|nr:GMC family oxidoreductase [Saprospiraceae bacterium]
MYFNNDGDKEVTYDAIVIGTGISGGWAAKELCEKGLKTLVLERGRMVRHVLDYPTASLDDWDFERRGAPKVSEMKSYAVQNRTGYTMNEASKHWWVNDVENPYTEKKRFDWIRGYHVGGRSIMWGRQSYRLSEMDFEANAKEGIAVDWPIRYGDLAPWYDHVERFAGISGKKEGLAQLPDGEFLPPMDLTCVEEEFRKKIAARYTDRLVTIGRVANLSQAHNGRGQCQYRNRCIRGCPFGAYFSSNASTLPAAEATGNMTLRPNSIVNSIIFDEKKNKAVGVRIIDAETNETKEYFARVIFSCASTLGSAFILLNSTSDRFPNGFGNDSGSLGRNLMDHHFRCGAEGTYDGFEDQYHKGRRPNGIYIPRFRNIDEKTKQKDFIRGYGYQGGASRQNWMRGIKELDMALGKDLKEALLEPGPWKMGINGFGECLPYEDNQVTLNQELRDKWGQPTLTIDAEFKANEMAMREDVKIAAAEMLEASGFKDIKVFDDGSWPGLAIHEMGTARMGRDPKSSVLNGWNQVHAATNVYVTDGSCMTSSACQNPSLTYMALTARAANHAVEELKKGNL